MFYENSVCFVENDGWIVPFLCWYILYKHIFEFKSSSVIVLLKDEKLLDVQCFCAMKEKSAKHVVTAWELINKSARSLNVKNYP